MFGQINLISAAELSNIWGPPMKQTLTLKRPGINQIMKRANAAIN